MRYTRILHEEHVQDDLFQKVFKPTRPLTRKGFQHHQHQQLLPGPRESEQARYYADKIFIAIGTPDRDTPFIFQDE